MNQNQINDVLTYCAGLEKNAQGQVLVSKEYLMQLLRIASEATPAMLPPFIDIAFVAVHLTENDNGQDCRTIGSSGSSVREASHRALTKLLSMRKGTVQGRNQ